MIGLVLVTHGRLATEFVVAMEHVVGPQEAIAAICIGPDDDMEGRRKDIAKAIREVDSKHIVIIEGNCWGNNYKGLPPAWDANMAISFHKYWNRNDAASIADIVKLRASYRRPVWLGESGENSNVWYRDAIALVEGEGIGWNFWPLKKVGFNQPLEIDPGPGWAKIVAWATGNGPRSSTTWPHRTPGTTPR